MLRCRLAPGSVLNTFPVLRPASDLVSEVHSIEVGIKRVDAFACLLSFLGVDTVSWSLLAE